MHKRRRLLQRLLLVILLPTATTSMSPSSSYKLRRYEPSDKPAIIPIFCDNIREEWGELHHNGRYLTNAERYIQSVVEDESSDLNNIDGVYFAKGGDFWTLTYVTKEEEDNDDTTCSSRKETETVVGMCGLEVITESEVELRRMCIGRNHRQNGCGSKIMIPVVLGKAKAMNGVKRVTLSTPEHGADVIRFYKKNGFVDMLDADGNPKKALNIHGTPIHEIFLERLLP